MEKIYKIFLKHKLILINYVPIIFIFTLWLIFAFPYFFKGQTVYPSNYLTNFFSPWNAYPGFASPVKNAAMPDIITQIFPWKELTINTFRLGQIPLWNPFSFSGTTQLANYQSAVLSPLNLLFFILPFNTAWNLLILLQPFLAGILMFLYTKTLKITSLASLLSATSFMFCGFLTTWMGYGTLGYVILWLPLALFAIEKFYEHAKFRYLILLSLTFPLSFFSGHFQISLYFAALVFTYLIFKGIQTKNKGLFIWTLVYMFAGLLLTMPQVLPSIESYLQSLRSSIFAKAESIPWAYLPTFLAPDLYGNPVTRNDWFGHYAEWNAYLGLIPLMFGSFALSCIRKNKYVLFFLIIGLISILLSFQSPIIDLLIFLKIPVLSTSALSRIIVLFSFSFAVLAGFGFDKLFQDIKQKNKKSIYSWLLFFGLLFVLLWLVIFFKLFLPIDKISIARQNLILPTFLFLFTSGLVIGALALQHLGKRKYIIFVPVLLILITSFEMYRFAVKWMPQDPKALIYPSIPISEEFSKLSTTNRFISNLGGEATIHYGLSSLDGYDAVYNKRYGEFIASLTNGDLEESSRSVVSFPKLGLYSKKAMDLLGVKYVVHKLADDHASWTFPFWNYKPNVFSFIYDDKAYQILQNNDAFPRTFLVNKFSVESDPQKILLKMFNQDTNLREEVVLEQNPNIKLTGRGSAIIKSYAPNKVLIESVSNGNVLLFLSDTYYPGWHAYIDGRQTQIFRADFSFRAITVPSGKHNIEFVYLPNSFVFGVLSFMVGLILMMGVSLRIFNKPGFKLGKS